MGAVLAAGREPDKAVQLTGNRHQGKHRPVPVIVNQVETQRESHIRDEGKGMGRIDGNRR